MPRRPRHRPRICRHGVGTRPGSPRTITAESDNGDVTVTYALDRPRSIPRIADAPRRGMARLRTAGGIEPRADPGLQPPVDVDEVVESVEAVESVEPVEPVVSLEDDGVDVVVDGAVVVVVVGHGVLVDVVVDVDVVVVDGSHDTVVVVVDVVVVDVDGRVVGVVVLVVDEPGCDGVVPGRVVGDVGLVVVAGAVGREVGRSPLMMAMASSRPARPVLDPEPAEDEPPEDPPAEEPRMLAQAVSWAVMERSQLTPSGSWPPLNHLRARMKSPQRSVSSRTLGLNPTAMLTAAMS